MSNGECIIGARHEEAIKALQEKDKELHDIDEQQWTAINTIRNRLPLWATTVISLLTFLAGLLLTLALK